MQDADKSLQVMTPKFKWALCIAKISDAEILLTEHFIRPLSKSTHVFPGGCASTTREHVPSNTAHTDQPANLTSKGARHS
jgi:hypothetical protein